jgi:hypothetical protein
MSRYMRIAALTASVFVQLAIASAPAMASPQPTQQPVAHGKYHSGRMIGAVHSLDSTNQRCSCPTDRVCIWAYPNCQGYRGTIARTTVCLSTGPGKAIYSIANNQPFDIYAYNARGCITGTYSITVRSGTWANYQTRSILIP